MSCPYEFEVWKKSTFQNKILFLQRGEVFDEGEIPLSPFKDFERYSLRKK